MAQRYLEISDKLKQFIQQQKIFFVATATADSRINISPKGMDTLRILGNNRIVWLNVTGSGNETAAHIQESPRMTIMFTAFEGDPMILRLYGSARAVHKNDPEWNELFSLFKPLPGSRQIFDFNVELVQTSCGMAVPFFDYTGEREQLTNWAINKGEEGIKDYWQKKNQSSLDEKPTYIVRKNL
ncbi:MAG TPA: pyridoxamine 5'-phosphate oxidase family protein [Gammaproteobacteria bacterium]|nr:pyridoxamine 5'-phosphate oxidase family protein [Gammaproteobacteria bacterium]